MEAATGTQEAFASLKQARNEFNQRWAYLSQGNEDIVLLAVPESLRDEVNAVEQDWNTLRRDTDAILASEQTVLSLHQVASTSPKPSRLQVEYEEVVDIPLESGAPAAQGRLPSASRAAERILVGEQGAVRDQTRYRRPICSVDSLSVES